MHMRHYKPEVTDEQWAKIAPLLPIITTTKKGGRPGADNRGCFEGILWILRTGSHWRDLPERYPSPATCWRRLNRWELEGVWEEAWREYLKQLDLKGVLDWDECFMDATFSAAKRGAFKSVKHVKERERSSWWWQAVKEYQSEFTSRLQTRARQLSSTQRSKMYESLDRDPAALRKILLG